MTNEEIIKDAISAGAVQYLAYDENKELINKVIFNPTTLTKFAELTINRAAQWIDCSVELPDYWIDVLVLRKYEGVGLGFCFEHESGANFWCIGGTSGDKENIEYPTYWQYLPLPPNAQQERN